MKPANRKGVRNFLLLVLVIGAFTLIYSALFPKWSEWLTPYARQEQRQEIRGRTREAIRGQEEASPKVLMSQEVIDIKGSLDEVRLLLVRVINSFMWPHPPAFPSENSIKRVPEPQFHVNQPNASDGKNQYSQPIPSSGRCPVVRRAPTLTWIPRADKYLMAMCVAGRMGNRMECLMSSMIAAAILNRTLVYPDSEFGYDFGSLVDLEHINECFQMKAHGPVMVTLSAFRRTRAAEGRPVVIDRLACPPNRRNEGSVAAFKETTGIRVVEADCASTYEASSISVIREEFARDYNYTDEVLAIGEGFGYNMYGLFSLARAGKEPWVVNCKVPVLRPHCNILYAAQDFVKKFLGPRYLSVHLRRTDFMGYCSDRRNNCNYYPIPRVATCLEQQAKDADCNIVFLATDASPYEFELLKDLLSRSPNWPLALVRLPMNLTLPSGLDWAQPLTQNQRQYVEVRASLDRVISAAGSTFLYSEQSTFSREVIRLRTAWQLNGCQDNSLCHGNEAEELPAHYNLETRSKIIAYAAQSRDLACVAKKTEKSGFKCWKVDKQNKPKNMTTKQP